MKSVESILIIILTAIGVFALFGTIAYEKQQQHECVLIALKMEKSAEDIRRICDKR